MPGDFTIGSDVWPGLSKLVEEAGEVLQLCGKLMQRPSGEHWSGDLIAKSQEELGDLYAAIDFFVMANPRLSIAEILARRHEKVARFTKWHVEQAE